MAPVVQCVTMGAGEGTSQLELDFLYRSKFVQKATQPSTKHPEQDTVEAHGCVEPMAKSLMW